MAKGHLLMRSCHQEPSEVAAKLRGISSFFPASRALRPAREGPRDAAEADQTQL